MRAADRRRSSATASPARADPRRRARRSRRSPASPARERAHRTSAEISNACADAGSAAPGELETLETPRLARRGPSHVARDPLKRCREREHLQAPRGAGQRDAIRNAVCVYPLIDRLPSMSTTNLGALSRRRSHRGLSGSPPVCRLARSVRRRSNRVPVAPCTPSPRQAELHAI